MIEIKISANTSNELQPLLAALYSAFCGSVQPTSDAPAEQPQKRTRKPKAELVGGQQPSDAAILERAGEAAAQQAQAPSAESLFATTEAPVPAKQPEQKDLISAFRALNEKKGTDAIVGLLGKFGAKTVALIPKDKWAEAIAEAGKLAA